jgi:nitrous oxidase accessory protein NosD
METYVMTYSTPHAKNLKPLWITLLFITVSLWLVSPVHAATYNVKTYGATGNGSTDDSQAIFNAIATASASAGNTVLFPAGNYLIGSARPSLQPRDVILKGDVNATLLMSDPQAQIVANGPNISIENLTISNTGSNKNSGVLFNTAKNSSVSKCTFNGWVNGIRIDGSTNATIQQNSFFMPKNETGVLLQNSTSASILSNTFTSTSSGYGYGIFSDDSANTIIANKNKFTSLKYGVYWKGNDVGSLNTSTNDLESCYYGFYCQFVNSVTLNSNTINKSSYAMYLFYNYNLTITDNKIDSPVNYGIYAGSTDFVPMTISGNVITNVGVNYYGMYLENHANVSNNTISGAGNPYAGIYLNNYFTPNQSMMQVTGNTISGFQYGVYSYYTTKLVVSNNNISAIRFSGIYSYGDFGVTANANTLKNCGTSFGAYAVVYVQPPIVEGIGQQYIITNNTFTAKSTAYLSYFCYVSGTHRSDIKMSGNTTNTMLPNYPFNH